MLKSEDFLSPEEFIKIKSEKDKRQRQEYLEKNQSILVEYAELADEIKRSIIEYMKIGETAYVYHKEKLPPTLFVSFITDETYIKLGYLICHSFQEKGFMMTVCGTMRDEFGSREIRLIFSWGV